ncbi:MAG: hypothetical protein IJU01_04615 [Lachnospiraceae bacterium]|nr:hypothetical protein [Lachnospiraceae bacterium]
MKEQGLYIIKQDFLDLVLSLGGNCDIANGTRRPVYCCLKDSIIEGLYWAIPTSDLNHRSPAQISKYYDYIQKPDDDLRSCYYHIGRTTKSALYKISSCFPITDKYIDHEFTTNGVHVIIRRAETVKEIRRKLARILAFESRRPNYFSQHISDIKNYLVTELQE